MTSQGQEGALFLLPLPGKAPGVVLQELTSPQDSCCSGSGATSSQGDVWTLVPEPQGHWLIMWLIAKLCDPRSLVASCVPGSLCPRRPGLVLVVISENQARAHSLALSVIASTNDTHFMGLKCDSFLLLCAAD